MPLSVAVEHLDIFALFALLSCSAYLFVSVTIISIRFESRNISNISKGVLFMFTEKVTPGVPVKGNQGGPDRPEADILLQSLAFPISSSQISADSLLHSMPLSASISTATQSTLTAT
ncbi:hypothetical protein NPIL_603491 [Nephila pilipes]|uniref:Uncharacterized protein n=1 Tax=Nephila pilipes TaxID=299642 RepID=A0A8X6P9C4_NEPPI|nr:hypothetical protein NPIL_603491 [Nephila pilipes]